MIKMNKYNDIRILITHFYLLIYTINNTISINYKYPDIIYINP